MENATFTTLTRQTGLLREMAVVANNIANMATAGFRQQGVAFSEFVKSSETGALSMATANVGLTSMLQGALSPTGAPFDLAIEGAGFFLVETPEGPALTRAGGFTPSPEGELLTHDGYRLLDAGGAPVVVPVGASAIHIASDGTISTQNQPIAQIGLVVPLDPNGLVHRGGVVFAAPGGTAPDDSSRLQQGFLESSNVNPILQVARMIEVQRAYEMGQKFLETENERVRNALQTFVK